MGAALAAKTMCALVNRWYYPDYRRRGYAETLLRRPADDARSQGRRGLVLTCKDRLVRYYARLGFVSEGASASQHGGVAWNQMRLSF